MKIYYRKNFTEDPKNFSSVRILLYPHKYQKILSIYVFLTENGLQRVQCNFWSCLIRFSLFGCIEDPVHQVYLGVVEHQSPEHGQ